MEQKNSLIFKAAFAFTDKTISLNDYIFDNANAIINSCIEQADIARSSSSKQDEYRTLIDNGYAFTIEEAYNKKGEVILKRIHSIANHWTAIKFIGENPDEFREWFTKTENQNLKVVTLRGIVSAFKSKREISKTTNQNFENLLFKFKELVSEQGCEWSQFLKFANQDESSKEQSRFYNSSRSNNRIHHAHECIDCWDEIPKARLKAMPETKLCLACATKKDHLNKINMISPFTGWNNKITNSKNLEI